jgi:peptidoglycan/LPS O-acetylase OafA/YrhL
MKQQVQNPSLVNTPAPTTKKYSNHILVLDGARAIACLVVLSYHMSLLNRDYGFLPPLLNTNIFTSFLTFFSAFFAQFGESGVILFFVLSGFLLFLPYAKALLFEGSWPSPSRYYLRRIFRILPGYYVTLFLIILFFHPEFLNANHWYDLWTFLTFNMGLNLSSQVNITFWTLAIEFQFYLLLPIFAWLSSLIVARGPLGWRIRKLSYCLLFLVIWGNFTRYWYMTDGQMDFLLPRAVSIALKPYIYGDTGKYYDVFAIGMFMAMVYTYMQNAPTTAYWNAKLRQSNRLMLATSVALLVFLPLQHITLTSSSVSEITLSFADPHIPPLVIEWMQWQVIGYSIAYSFFLLALISGPAKLRRPFECSLLRWFSSISFSLYMWHIPFMLLFIYTIVHNVHNQNWNAFAQYGLFWCWTLVVIIPISATFYRCIEQPGVRLGERVLAATQAWEKRLLRAPLPAQASPINVWSEARTQMDVQLQGQPLVQGLRHKISRTRLVPLHADGNQITA